LDRHAHVLGDLLGGGDADGEGKAQAAQPGRQSHVTGIGRQVGDDRLDGRGRGPRSQAPSRIEGTEAVVAGRAVEVGARDGEAPMQGAILPFRVAGEPGGLLTARTSALVPGFALGALPDQFLGNFAPEFPSDPLGEVLQVVDVGVLGRPLPVQPVHDAGSNLFQPMAALLRAHPGSSQPAPSDPSVGPRALSEVNHAAALRSTRFWNYTRTGLSLQAIEPGGAMDHERGEYTRLWV